MKRSSSFILSRIHEFWHDRSGVTAAIVALLTAVFIGLMGFVIDIGHVYQVQRSLQASTDAAALAAGQDIYATPSTAIATAKTYSAVAGNKNASSTITATMVSGYPQLKCLTSTGVPCTTSDPKFPYNAIVVKQQATVNMFFAQIFGLKTITIGATATSGAAGAKSKPLNVMIVLDTTASMNSADPGCSITGATRIACALAGVRTLLGEFDPSVDQVGLMVFPGLTNSSQVPYEYNCQHQPAITAYKNSPVYNVTPGASGTLSTDYMSSGTSKTLNTSSDLVIESGGGSSSCKGISAVGGVGTFYADAITAAQTALLNAPVIPGQPNPQNVIIFLSDGDASASSSNMVASKVNNQCKQAVTAAQNATAAGTWVYAIAYGSSTALPTGSCSTDKAPYSACYTMQNIASSTTKFYSDSSACVSSNKMTDLVSVFQNIGQTLLEPRLFADNTP